MRVTVFICMGELRFSYRICNLWKRHSPICESHLNESYHIWMSHPRIIHVWTCRVVTRVCVRVCVCVCVVHMNQLHMRKLTHNESCHVWMSHIWMRSNINESCHIWMGHVWTSHTYKYKWVMSTITRSITHKNKNKNHLASSLWLCSVQCKSPHTSAKEPHISAKEPYLSGKEPYEIIPQPRCGRAQCSIRALRRSCVLYKRDTLIHKRVPIIPGRSPT